MIYQDGIGSYQVGRAQVISVVLRFGDEAIRDRDGGAVGIMSLPWSGKGVKMVIEERFYVAPKEIQTDSFSLLLKECDFRFHYQTPKQQPETLRL